MYAKELCKARSLYEFQGGEDLHLADEVNPS
jgi:hypothetical protein